MNENGDLYLDVAEAYMENGYYKYAEPILAKLVKTKNYDLVRFVIALLIGIFNPFLHEYSCKAQPTLNNHITKLSRLYIKQRNSLSSPLVFDQIYHISTSKQSRPRSGSSSSYLLCL